MPDSTPLNLAAVVFVRSFTVTLRNGWGPVAPSFTATYTNNRRDGFSYDLAGNLTNDSQAFTYDATGQQATANSAGFALTQGYDGNGVRAKKTENGTTTYYLRSSVLGGQVVAEIGNSGGTWIWFRGYVQLGGQLLAVQQDAAVRWVHEDPVTKTKRMTDANGAVISTIVFDPWGGAMGGPWSQNVWQQRRQFTTYERDGNESDEAMFRRYNRWHSRFDHPDPYDGSYDLTDPQSLNRYAYVQNDPVTFVDPTGLDLDNPGFIPPSQNGWQLMRNPTESFINWVQDLTSIHYNRQFSERPWLRFEGFGPFTFGQRPAQTHGPIWERHSTEAEREQFRKQNEACKNAATEWLKNAQAKLDKEPEKGPLQRAISPFSVAGFAGGALQSVRSGSGIVGQGLRILNAGLNGVRGGILVTGAYKGGKLLTGSLANFVQYAAKLAACDALNSPTDFKDRVTR